MQLLRKGKVKEVYEAGTDELEFLFTDNISVFDKIIPTQIPRKGETLCRTSAYWFTVAERLGIRNHFRSLKDGNRMRVRRVDVIADYAKISPTTRNYLIPLELIVRWYVAGSLHDRLKSGETPPESLGFPKGRVPKYGEQLPEPLFEHTTKLEKVDRPVDQDEAMRIAGLTADDYEDIREAVLSIDERMNEEVARRGLVHVDGKKEFAYDEERHLMVVDTFGTADEDRWWDRAEWEQGRCVELSKEFVRQHYRRTGYYDRLTAARKAGKPEPDIPPLPPKVARETSELYVRMYERITGQKL